MPLSILIKNMNQTEFTVQCEDSDTVGQLKEKIFKEQKFPVENQTIIFSGQVKDNSLTIGSLGLKERDFLVLMNRKPKAKPATTSSTPTITTTPSTSTPSTSTPTTTTPSTSTNTPSTTTPSTTIPSTPPIQTGIIADPSLVSTLEDMGFGKQQAELALRAAFNDVNRAIQYLSEYPEGIPDRLLNQINNPIVPPTPTTPSTSGNTPSTPTQTTPSTTGGGGGVFAPLRDVPQFSHLRFMVQQNPDLLQPLLSTLAQENPALLQLINQHQQEFLDLLKEPVDPNHLSSLPQGLGTQQIRVTEEEKQAIDRLEQLVSGMGIDRSKVIEAYFSCDKNEELAANFLLEGGYNDED